MAKDFGRTDEFAPDSSLDSIDPGMYYELADGSVLNVQVNDWVDIDPAGLPEDKYWGSSHQVAELSPDAVVVRAYNEAADLFELSALSPQWILNNYRRVPNG